MPASARALARWLPKGQTLPEEDWRARHRWLLLLLAAHAVVLPLFGVYRGYSLPHSVLEGGAIGVLAVAGAFAPFGARARAAVIAFGLVTSSAVVVHFSGGTIEAHFHFFVVIILLVLYEDWLPFLIALGYVVVHHGALGAISPDVVYNHPAAVESPWRWALIHGAFVAAAGAGGIASWRLNEASRARAGLAMADAVRSHESNELKSRFIATTSHELRTPLTSISGFATTLLHRWTSIDDAEKVQLLEIIEAQSERLRRLIEDLLLLSAAESGKLRVRPSPVVVRDVVEQVIAELAMSGVRVDVPEDICASVDERQFTQVVVNYLTNAQKYGAPPVTVTARRVEGWVELAVADVGRGVDTEFAPRLFEAFTREADDVPAAGAGLGLSIVDALVQAQGGRAWYEPNRPRGACFKARFPEARVAQPQPAGAPGDVAVAPAAS